MPPGGTAAIPPIICRLALLVVTVVVSCHTWRGTAIALDRVNGRPYRHHSSGLSNRLRRPPLELQNKRDPFVTVEVKFLSSGTAKRSKSRVHVPGSRGQSGAKLSDVGSSPCWYL